MWGISSSEAWAVGASGTAVHYVGGNWSTVAGTATSQNLRSVWGSASGSVWAVGLAGGTGNAVMQFWNGTTWATPANAPADGMFAIMRNERHGRLGGGRDDHHQPGRPGPS